MLFAALCLTATLSMPAADQVLDLGARIQPLPAANRFGEAGFHVWCGSPLRTADGRYHLYYSRWPIEATFHPGWAIFSEVAYAVADRPEGPYRHVNVALPSRGQQFWDGSVTHNPTVVQVGNRFALFYTGNVGNGLYTDHRNHQRVGVALADRPEGPWTRLDQPIVDVSEDPTAFDALCTTNPAACVMPDGRILVHYKAVAKEPGKVMGGAVRYGAAIADRVEGPYRKVPSKIFLPPAGGDGKHWMVAEDSFIWYSARYGNRYYAVARDVLGLFSGSAGGIALFQSQDGLDWVPAPNPKVLDGRYPLEGGGVSKTRLERPMVLCQDGEPVLLFGAADGYRKDGAGSANVQFPIRALTPP